MKIKKSIRYDTGMGTINDNSGTVRKQFLEFLTPHEFEEFDNIGYTGKDSKGKYTTQENYLNNLDKGMFQLTTIRQDGGDFSATYELTRFYEHPINKQNEHIYIMKQMMETLKAYNLTNTKGYSLAESYLNENKVV